MSEVQIQDLAQVTPTNNDLVLLSQNGGTRNASVQALRAIVNDLLTGGTDKTLSAEQGKILYNYFTNVSQKIGDTSQLTYTDLVSGILDLASNKIDKNNIINNLAATQTGFVLDATQGKILGDKLLGIVAATTTLSASQTLSGTNNAIVQYTVTANCFAMVEGVLTLQATDATLRTQNARLLVNSSTIKAMAQLHTSDTNRRTQAISFAGSLNTGDVITLVAYNDQSLSTTYYGSSCNLSILAIPK